MLELSDAQKLMIMAVCAGLVSATILVTVCVVTPHCWFYQCLWGRREERDRRKKLLYGSDLIPLPECPVTTTPVTANGKGSPTPTVLAMSRGKPARDSTYSSMSASSRGETSIYSETSGDTPDTVEEDDDAVYGHVSMTLEYQPQLATSKSSAPVGGRLLIHLKEVQNLPPRQYGGVCDPYAVIKILKGRGKKRRTGIGSVRRPSCIRSSGGNGGTGGHRVCQYQTQVMRKTQCPLFNETFAVELTKNDLKECSLQVSVYDVDKYSNDTQVGEATVVLKDLQLLENPEERLIKTDLKEPKQYNGEILFGLSYLPTAERLTVNILKANSLVSPLNNVESFFPCVRVLLFHNGKLKKKKKTAAQQGTLCPVYNESLTFDVPQAELDRVVFMLVVSHRDPSQGGTLSSPESPTTPKEAQQGGQQQHIGKVLLGSNSHGSLLHHWNAMKQSPRKQVTQWHTLR